MKILSLALIASVAITGYAHAQTETPAPAPPAQSSAPPASTSSSKSVSHECKKEARKLCGIQARGSELKDCIKANLDLNKFSDTCATQYKNAAAAKKSSS